ncbi:hypothetical protein C8J56DRAFT_1055104 [Mycena floridula]|nr:hypothetical protein C8J56DRAFT_1055104 [Mycena floridula]
MSGIADVIVLRQVSRPLKKDVDAYLVLAFDVECRLHNFLGNRELIKRFRKALKKSGSLLSGSFMLAFFDRREFRGSDMDIFMPAIFAANVAEVLLMAGFNYVPRRWDERLWTERLSDYVNWESTSDTIIGVLDFYNEKWQNIQIVVTHRAAFDAILSFHSTVVMNAFDGKTAFSIYPLATLNASINLALDLQTSRGRDAIKKYKDRGYAPEISLGTYPTFDRSIRCIGDAGTWSMTFEDDGKISMGNALNLGNLHAESWSLREVTLGPSIHFEYFTIRTYEHQYFNVVSEDIAIRAYDAMVSAGPEPDMDVWGDLMFKWCRMAQDQTRALPVDTTSEVIWNHWSAAWSRITTVSSIREEGMAMFIALCLLGWAFKEGVKRTFI